MEYMVWFGLNFPSSDRELWNRVQVKTSRSSTKTASIKWKTAQKEIAKTGQKGRGTESDLSV